MKRLLTIVSMLLVPAVVLVGEERASGGDLVFMPTVIASVAADGEPGASYGASIKAYAYGNRYFPVGPSFEAGYEFIPTDDLHRFSLVGLSLFGFLNPGALVELGKQDPAWYAIVEFDPLLFFALLPLAVFEQPIVIPSLAVRVITDFDTEPELSYRFRLSFPLYRRAK